jgi:hypothetical protein
MKIRKQRRLIVKRMGALALSFDHTGMYHTRQIKPCKSYSCWCSDCNAVLFRKTEGRFPHTYAEFSDFEFTAQTAEHYGDVDACVKQLQDQFGDDAGVHAMRDLMSYPKGRAGYKYWLQVINKLGEKK